MRKIDKLGSIRRPVLADRLFALFGFVVILLFSYVILHNALQSDTAATSSGATSSTSSSSTVNTSSYTVLAPATTPPKVAECSQALSFDSNGDPGPITCPNGDLNVQAWNSLATLEPTVLSLGIAATESQVQSAICTDVNNTLSDANTTNSYVVETTVYQIAALYYGWNFSTNPSSVLSGGNC